MSHQGGSWVPGVEHDERDLVAARADNAILRNTIAKLVASNEELAGALAAREARIGELENEVEQLRSRITSTEIAT